MKKFIQFTIALGAAFFLMGGIAHAQCPHAKTACSKAKVKATAQAEQPANERVANASATPVIKVIKVSQEAPRSERTAPATAATAAKKTSCCAKQAKKACCAKQAKASCAGKTKVATAEAIKEETPVTGTMVKNQ
jgi:hypothetical protein